MRAPRLFLIVAGLIASSAVASGQSLQLLETYKGPDPTGCIPPAATTAFLSTDLHVNAYFQLNGLAGTESIALNWIGPDNNVDITSSFFPANSGSECFFIDLSIAQYFAPAGFGPWQVQVIVNGNPLAAPVGFEVDSAVLLPTTLTLTTTPNPSVQGQAVTLTAAISPAFLSSTLYFLDNGVEFGAANPSHGSATFTVSQLSPGTHYLTAYYGGSVNYAPVVSPAAVQIVNAPGSQIGAVTASGGTPQSATVGAAFPNPLQVTVTDPTGNRLSGIVVTFTAPSTGAGAVLSAAAAVTNSSGVATVSASANFIPGSYFVTASAGSQSASFSLVNLAGPGNSDLALGRPATQSSTLAGYASAAAGSAVDGNTDGAFFDGSVSSTDLDGNPWWQVDLGSSTAIGSITIWNRTDCCGSRLSDYWVFVSSTPFSPTDTVASLQLRAGTWSSHQTTAPNPATTITAGTQGQYVRVALSNPGYLSLAEVQVFAPANQVSTDLAVGKSATQSSTLPGYPTAGASSAVDGNTDGVFGDGSVTATNLDPNAWWQVDLGASTIVSSIGIWNRTDCCGARLTDYWVFVSDTPFGPTDTPSTLQFRAGTFASYQTGTPNPSIIIPVGAEGRYVRVQLAGTDYLSLAEVQVFGTSAAPSGTDLALGMAATESSTFPGYPTAGASSAVDGNTDGVFSDGSVTATNLDVNAWWQVDLGTPANVGSIVIWNRTDCCAARLSDYWVFVSNTPFGSADTPSTLQFRAGTFSNHQTATPNPSIIVPVGAQGRYVRVQLSGTNYLSLAEVQVVSQ